MSFRIHQVILKDPDSQEGNLPYVYHTTASDKESARNIALDNLQDHPITKRIGQDKQKYTNVAFIQQVDSLEEAQHIVSKCNEVYGKRCLNKD